MEENVHDLKTGYKVESKQGNWLVVTSPAGVEISVAKASVRDVSDLELSDVNYYNQNVHGKITDQIAVITCMIVKDSKRSKVKAAIVISDNSHQPHVRIIK